MAKHESTYDLRGTLNYASDTEFKQAAAALSVATGESKQEALGDLLIGRWCARKGNSLTFDQRFVIPDAVALMIESWTAILSEHAESGDVTITRIDARST